MSGQESYDILKEVGPRGMVDIAKAPQYKSM